MNDETTVVKIKIRPMTLPEQMYCYQQSNQLSWMTGLIGHLRADMGKEGDGFFSSFFDFRADLKSEDFKEEFDAVIDALRNDHLHGGMLRSRNSMAAYCRKHSECEMKDDERSYGVRVDTEKRAYLLRLNPHPGEYNLYCYCYIKKWLDGHLQQAEKGIRFIDPNHKELFRIPDGDRIRITYADGKKDDRICRYVDDYHVEIGSGWNSLLHICQFAEMMEQTSSTVIPLRSSLPERCYSVLPGSGELVIIKKGESGYYRTDIDMGIKEENQAVADEYNAKLGISKAQEQAMSAGSMFGFQVPAADPQNYDDRGWPRIAGSHMAEGTKSPPRMAGQVERLPDVGKAKESPLE